MTNRFEELQKAGHLQPGKVTVLTVLHDDDCAHWRHEECDCEPDHQYVTLDPPKGKHDAS